ncbi:SNF2-related protein [Methylobacterium mesophilicum]|nr:SNF2-related protein [Methylobacterium mesophilicum]
MEKNTPWQHMPADSGWQTKLLRAARSPEEYRIYKAALEWDLADPIVIESRKDVKSEAQWRDRVEPFNHQVSNLITFCRRLPVTLLADDVGLGKTISAGLVMSELIARSRLSRALIVCPKLLGPQWKEELETKFEIPAEVATGRDLLSANLDGVGAIITTYNSARLYLEKMPADRFEMLILDEAHKLRNLYGTPEPPKVAQVIRSALAARRFRFVLMLTATPIQNRLWDLYSLVDLLTVARGHENPFGNEGQFARRFIAGDREQARQLKPEAAEAFRSIVYGYMSRVRRGDAKLHFPDRKVQLHRVQPTPAELELIAIVAKGIEKLNRLAQIGILQALTSSPHALSAQLDNMERNGTIAPDFAGAVRAVVRGMTTSAKLDGLGRLITQLKHENPDSWRLVVFTGRRETQTTIQEFLEGHGLTVGIINGTSGARNQETIGRFRANPPGYRVIVSTEAGSEGVNLQVANVLVNYDLPWNPMIVEQRIGRVQRLASQHAHVSILNVTLQGTFEEYIVGRLMEKLQMSTSAIGDIESLLEGSVGGEDGAAGFEERIRELVVAALKGADVKASVAMAEQSIAAAKQALLEEEKRINAMLGDTDGQGYVGPRAPSLPPQTRSMEYQPFALGALGQLGARVTPLANRLFAVEDEGGQEVIRFERDAMSGTRSSLYQPGSPAFSRMVQRMVVSGRYAVRDLDEDPRRGADAAARQWVESFGGTLVGTESAAARRWFEGVILVRVRATVAHDGYERLLEVRCAPRNRAKFSFTRDALAPLPLVLDAASDALGLSVDQVMEAARQDPGIAEFTRFYLERRGQEMASAGQDARKRAKMEEDFTPRLSFVLAGAEGAVLRDVQLRVSYRVGEGGYADELTIVPSSNHISAAPALVSYGTNQQPVPETCLDACAISGQRELRHRLQASELNGRRALPKYVVRCELTNRCLLADEVERSAMTGKIVGRDQLKTSAVSGKHAEAIYFGRCVFSGDDALRSELLTSDLSGKLFREDWAASSAVSGRIGHQDEFVACHETRGLLVPSEGERCSVTGHLVRPGILESCAATGTRALPSELGRCVVTGSRVVKRLLVPSSISGALMLEEKAVRAAHGVYCLPAEAHTCGWSGQFVHPEDVRICALTGIGILYTFATNAAPPRLAPLVALLDGVNRATDRQDVWGMAAAQEAAALRKGKCRIEAGVASPNGLRVAMASEVRTLLGLKSRQAGFVYEPSTNQIQGRVALGKRGTTGWSADDVNQ